jgi:hypothetical protein
MTTVLVRVTVVRGVLSRLTRNVVAAFITWQAVAAAAQDANPPTLRAGAIASEMRIDGVLDEPAWQAAEATDTFRQTDPEEGAPTSVRTIVRVLAGANALIVGIVCEDDPASVVSRSVARDADLDGEDHVQVVLGPFRDGRSGYAFAINPSGARHDSLIGGGDASENQDWDGIWEAAAARQPNGWSVEIRIPIQTLSFNSALREWDFNVQRRLERRLETNRWAFAARQYRVIQTSRAGLLTGLPVFDVGLGLTVRPAVSTGQHRRRVPAESRRHSAARHQRHRFGDDQHRLCRNRSRHTSHQSHAISAVLPREADVLSRRLRHLWVWSWCG